jgi:hypothetical protein
VTAESAEGAATQAVLRAVAEAFGVPRRDVTLVTGAISRNKVIEVEGLRYHWPRGSANCSVADIAQPGTRVPGARSRQREPPRRPRAKAGRASIGGQVSWQYGTGVAGR